MKTEEMYCPLCVTKLKSGEYFEYEDCCGVRTSLTYTCSNPECELHKSNCVWNDYGDFFSMDLSYTKARELFPDDKYEAYNSFAKVSATEIFKKGLRGETYLHPILCLYFLKPYIEHTYKSDMDGNVIKRGFKIKFLKRDQSSGKFVIGYISGIHMLIFCLKEFYRNKKRCDYSALHDTFKGKSWDKRWWSLLVTFYTNTFYKKLRSKCFK